MWLATKQGFYSIVKDNKSSDYIVRARSRVDLQNLKKLVESISDRGIITTRESDYMFRIFVNQQELFEITLSLSIEIDYHNFKDKVKDTPTQKDKVGYYSEIWGTMFDYQIKHNKLFQKPNRFNSFDIFNEDIRHYRRNPVN